MNFLFVHQNFPGQFKFLAPALAAQSGNTVLAMTMREKVSSFSDWQGVRLVPVRLARRQAAGTHPWLTDFEAKLIRAEACLNAAMQLKQQGFAPDVIIAHPGWGESLFLKDVWPQARLGVYSEFFYHAEGADYGFDPEFPPVEPVFSASRLRLKNINMQLHFGMADAGISPTLWQADTFPEPFRKKISVIHDGIDTRTVRPDSSASLSLALSDGGAVRLSVGDEIVTFVNRNLEPYRGYHIFMRALPEILKSRPHARVILVGGDGVSYGPAPVDGRSWRNIFRDEVKMLISAADWQRVHFIGRVDYATLIQLFQIAAVHVYLTYPFVLSWSLLEAMSAGCAVVGSDTEPVREVVTDGVTGRLVNFFDAKGLAEAVCSLLADPDERKRLGSNARRLIVNQYDLHKVCLPGQVRWVRALADSYFRESNNR